MPIAATLANLKSIKSPPYNNQYKIDYRSKHADRPGSIWGHIGWTLLETEYPGSFWGLFFVGFPSEGIFTVYRTSLKTTFFVNPLWLSFTAIRRWSGFPTREAVTYNWPWVKVGSSSQTPTFWRVCPCDLRRSDLGGSELCKFLCRAVLYNSDDRPT